MLTLAASDAAADTGAVFSGVPGVVEVVERAPGVVDLTVEGSVGATLKAAASLDVERISTAGDDDLEEAFLSFYREGSGK